VFLLSVEDAGRKTMVDDWGTIVERRMDSDSLGDAGVMLLVFGMLVCVSSQSMQQIAEVVIEACKRFAGRCKWFLLPDKSVDAPSGQVLSKVQRGLS
jgi:hypothetical protein